jgi:hypothetical protein
MKHPVLVIDDKFSQRKPGYTRLEEACSAFGGFEVEFHYLASPNELSLKMRANRFTAVILDAVLDEDWIGFTVTSALKEIPDSTPIALLSGQWDETNVEQVNEAWKRTNCRTFIHWRDIDPTGNGQLDFAVRPFIRMISESQQLEANSGIESSDSMWLLHISDIQTGGFDERRLKLEAKRSADLVLQETGGIQPTFVAFTGDVSEYGSLPQYGQARDWISYFLGRLGCGPLPSTRVLYVPGNHDVNLSLAASARLMPYAPSDGSPLALKLVDELRQPDLVSFGYLPFRSFHDEVCGRSLLSAKTSDQSFAWVEGRYRHLGIIFYGINTAQPANAFGIPDRRVDADALANLSVELAGMIGAGPGRPIIVGLGHHSPVAADADGAVKNTGDFDTFFRSSPQTALFLHGHTHEHDLSYANRDGLRLVRSCATTLTKGERARPSDTLRGFNILEFKRVGGVVDALVGKSYGWIGTELKEVKRGQWMRHTDSLFREVV